MIELIDTFLFIKENSFNSSAPMLFTCDTVRGFENYWIKYILEENQFDCLVYEILCQRLAMHIGISVPNIALANIKEGSFSEESLIKNTTFFKPKVIAFASKALENEHYMLSQMETIPDKNTFNQYKNAEDFIKIAIFDLYVNNKDRTEENFNILLTKIKPSEIYAIDHFDCFGDRNKVGQLIANMPYNIDETIIRSPICMQAISYLDRKVLSDTVESYNYLCDPKSIERIVNEVFESVPDSWNLSPNLDEKIKSSLLNTNRLCAILEKVNSFITFCKRK